MAKSCFFSYIVPVFGKGQTHDSITYRKIRDGLADSVDYSGAFGASGIGVIFTTKNSNILLASEPLLLSL